MGKAAAQRDFRNRPVCSAQEMRGGFQAVAVQIVYGRLL